MRSALTASARSAGATVQEGPVPLTCSAWAAALAPVDDFSPDVVVVLQQGFAPQGVREIAQLSSLRPDLRWIVLTDCESAGFRGALLRAGADLVLPWAVEPARWAQAISDAAAGRQLLSPSARAELIEADPSGRRAAERLTRLSPRELEVVRRLVQGVCLGEGAGRGRRSVAAALVGVLYKLQVGRRRDAVELWERASRPLALVSGTSPALAPPCPSPALP